MTHNMDKELFQQQTLPPQPLNGEYQIDKRKKEATFRAK